MINKQSEEVITSRLKYLTEIGFVIGQKHNFICKEYDCEVSISAIHYYSDREWDSLIDDIEVHILKSMED